MTEFFSFARLLEEIPLILKGMPVTLSIVVISTILGLLLGIVLAIVRINKVPFLYQTTGVGISFFRGTPIIVQLFVVYYGIPFLLKYIGINANRWDKFIFVNITYILNTASMFAEIVRGAINGVDIGQREAALSCGLTGIQAFRRVVAPQALLIALPSFSVSILALLQNTSLGFTIGLVDMVGQVRSIGIRTHHVFEGYVFTAAVFVVLSLLLHLLFGSIEKKLTYKIMRDDVQTGEV